RYNNIVSEFLSLKNVELIPYSDMHNLIELLSKMELVVTNKLHVGIVSIAKNAKVISIPTHQKTIRLYKQLDLENFCLDRNYFSDETVLQLSDVNCNFEPDWNEIQKGIDKINSYLDSTFKVS